MSTQCGGPRPAVTAEHCSVAGATRLTLCKCAVTRGEWFPSWTVWEVKGEPATSGRGAGTWELGRTPTPAPFRSEETKERGVSRATARARPQAIALGSAQAGGPACGDAALQEPRVPPVPGGGKSRGSRLPGSGLTLGAGWGRGSCTTPAPHLSYPSPRPRCLQDSPPVPREASPARSQERSGREQCLQVDVAFSPLKLPASCRQPAGRGGEETSVHAAEGGGVRPAPWCTWPHARL